MLNIRSLTCNPLQERCYLAWREAPRCVLVDPGCYGDDELRLLGKILTEEGLRPEAILQLTQMDVHSLARNRVNVTLPHIGEFHDAWDVKAGNKMWLDPDKRAQLW